MERRGFFEGRNEKLWPGKRETPSRVFDTQTWYGDTCTGYELSCCRGIWVTERTIDKKGRSLHKQDIELGGWWTSLTLSADKIIALNEDSQG